MDDFSRFFLFTILAVAVLVLLGHKQRPTASSPLESNVDVTDSDTMTDPITRGAGFANVPGNGGTLPLSLMMPIAAMQPAGSC